MQVVVLQFNDLKAYADLELKDVTSRSYKLCDVIQDTFMSWKISFSRLLWNTELHIFLSSLRDGNPSHNNQFIYKLFTENNKESVTRKEFMRLCSSSYFGAVYKVSDSNINCKYK